MPKPAITIASVRIEGFRSCERTSIDFNGNLSVLIGPNGAGKTNILQALTLLRMPSETLRHYSRTDAAIARTRLKVQFKTGKNRLALRSTLNYLLDEDGRENVVDMNEQWRLVPRTAKAAEDADHKWYSMPAFPYLRPQQLRLPFSELRKRFSLRQLKQLGLGDNRGLLPNRALSSPIEAALTFRSRIGYYSAAQFTNPTRCPSSIEIDEDRDLIRSSLNRREHHKFLLDLFRLRDAAPSKYAAYMAIVGKNGLELISNLFWKQVKVAASQVEVRMGGKIVKRNRQRLLIVPTVQVRGNRLSFNQLSEGTFKTLALVFYLITDASDLLLIEEPEVCVHHGLLSSIIELIKAQSHEKQIIFSTHSDFVLDQVTPEQVFTVTRHLRRGTEVRSLVKGYSRDAFAALRLFLRESGNLGDYWRQGGLDL